MEDVIVVTINYRLHFLGFASIPEMGIYGNAGLKDQQMALEWIFENIGNFGGDQKNVTMFGNSSGAIMVHLQSLNSKSRQYFQKMILHNCSTLCDYAIQSRPEEKTKRVVQILKGRFDTPKEIYESLMKIDAKDLFKYRLKCQEAYEKRRRLEMIIKPSIEVESDEAFLTKSPIDIIREKHLNSSDMPIMIGICNGEGLFHSNYAIKNIKELNDKISDLIPPMLNIEYGSKEYLEFGNEMRSFYFGTKGLTRETFNSYPNLSHDLHFSIPLTMFNETYREYYPHSKQFVFEFCIESKLNYIKPHSNVKHLPGVFHSDEMSYLFE
jgi:carboxylesterase type B